jgi:diguanylate cyclase (GGDEF)-like protein
MDEVLARLTASGTPFGLMHLDLDYFKEVNDTHGHAAGDAVLEAVSQVLADETRAPDTVARVGGDEFVLVFQGLVASDRLEAIAGRILRRLEQPVAFDPGVELRISGSIGVTVSTFYRPPDPARMLHDADLALYASKRAGRGRMTFHRPAPVAAGEPPGDGRAPG